MNLKLRIRPNWHRKLLHKLGYDIEKFNKQLTLESHLRALLPVLDADLVIDAGAHMGSFARTLRYTGYQGEIISFEPAGHSFSTLAHNTKSDPKWSAHQLALSDRAGEAELHWFKEPNSTLNSLHPMNSFGEQKFRGRVINTETVTLGRLDEFLDHHVPDFARRRVFLKMDTQGHDRSVFAGAGDYAGRFCGLLSEMSVMPIYDGIPTYAECLEIYRKHGYEVTGMYTIRRNGKTGHIIEFDCAMAPTYSVV